MKQLITTIFLIFFGFSGGACDCIMQPLAWYAKNTELIFTGTVVTLLDSIDASDYLDAAYYQNKSYRVKVKMQEILKAGNLQSDTLTFTSDDSNCDPLYTLGETYLLFARQTEHGHYQMVSCAPWGNLNESGEKIQTLKTALQ